MYRAHETPQGFSLVEVIVVSAITLLVFGGIFASVRFSLDLIANSRARLSAVSVATDRLEYIRSLPYDQVGTIAGIPNGPIPQQATSSLNGFVFSERVLIEYIDDPSDGVLGSTTNPDINNIPSDYKRVKVELAWNLRGATSSVALVSNIAPRSIETNTGGGSVRVTTIGADFLPLAGVPVRLLNDTTTSTINDLRYSNADGAVLYSGAPAASSYNLVVGGALGFSEARTYAPTTTMPTPNDPPFTVSSSSVTSLIFAVDTVSDLDVTMLSDWNWQSVTESFATTTGISTSTDVVVSGGNLRLQDTAGLHAATGTAYLAPLTPTPLLRYDVLSVTADRPVGTVVRARFYEPVGTSSMALIPDSELPGNSTGFTTRLIDLSELDAVTFSSIIVALTLETTNAVLTPAVDEVTLFYTESEVPAAFEPVRIHSDKTIGRTLGGDDIFKYDISTTTDADGEVELPDSEWGTYQVRAAGYDIADACPRFPIPLAAGVDTEATVLLQPDQAETLFAFVVDGAGVPIPGAAAELRRVGFSQTATSSPCGTAFFSGGVPAETDFELEVSAPGFVTDTQTAIGITGPTQLTVTLLEI